MRRRRWLVPVIGWTNVALLVTAAVAGLFLYSFDKERQERERFELDRVVRACGDVVDRSVRATETLMDSPLVQRITTTATRTDGGKAVVVYEQRGNSLGFSLVRVDCDVS